MKTFAILLFALVIGQAFALGRLRKGQRCDYDPKWCARGLTCVGKPGNMRCFRIRALGKSCGLDPFSVCEDGLECEDNVCVKPKIGVRGLCNMPGDVCEDGLICIGRGRNKRCLRPRKEGQKCRDPFLVCAEGLECDDGICVKPKVGKGGSCTDDDECEDGLDCVGRKGRMKCFPPRTLGERCDNLFAVCEEGLVCKHKRCTKPKVAKGGSCNDPGDECDDGLSCVGPMGNMKCFPLKTLGETCDVEPFWVCEDGLICKENICTKPKVGKGGSCTDDDECEDGLDCVGRKGRMKCFPPRTLGERCDNLFAVCEEGLVCKHKRCTKPKVAKGGSCNDPGDECDDGLKCVGPEGNRKCFAPRVKGETCGRNPFQVCDTGLACKHKICVKH